MRVVGLALGIVVLLGGTSEGKPSGYRCGKNGKAITDVGCKCPRGKVAALDAQNVAVCNPAPKPKQPKPEPVAAPPRRAPYTRTSTVTVKVAISERTRALTVEKSSDALAALFKQLEENPTSKQACRWQAQVAGAMTRFVGASHADKVKQIEKLVALYEAVHQKRTLPATEARNCHDDAAALAGDYARAYHSESLKTLNPDTLVYADRLYVAFLRAFPDNDSYAENQLYLAELLWVQAEKASSKSALWDRAAAAFTNVVKTGKVSDAQLEDADKAATLALKNSLAVDPRTKASP